MADQQPTYSPAVHPKNAQTGKGKTPMTPGNADSVGTSNHVPVVGKSTDYSSEQQQQ